MAALRSGRRRLVTVVAALGLFVASLLAVPKPAFADSGNASCVGLELSDISPPGTNPEFPDGGPGFVAEMTELAAEVDPDWPRVPRLVRQGSDPVWGLTLFDWAN